LIALVVIGLLGADFHWLSDTIAGFYLGTATAIGVVALLKAKP
jgi:membrane-associated phospholipid phosphatase